MKKKIAFSVNIVIVLVLACMLQACPSHRGEVLAIASATSGTWEWVKTTTPSRVLTPQTEGYTKQLALLSDDKGAYVGFYKNDTLQLRLNETPTDTTHTFVDPTRKTVLVKYGGAGFIKYYIIDTGNSSTIASSEVLNPYSDQADTIRNYYERTSKSLYPY